MQGGLGSAARRSPSVLPAGLFASATVTLPANPEMTFPTASSALTIRPKSVPAVTVDGGSEVTTSCVAEAGVTSLAFVTAAVSPGPLAWSV